MFTDKCKKAALVKLTYKIQICCFQYNEMFQILLTSSFGPLLQMTVFPSGPSGLSACLFSLDLASCTILSSVEFAALNVLIAFLKVSALSKPKCLPCILKALLIDCKIIS